MPLVSFLYHSRDVKVSKLSVSCKPVIESILDSEVVTYSGQQNVARRTNAFLQRCKAFALRTMKPIIQFIPILTSSRNPLSPVPNAIRCTRFTYKQVF